MDKTQLTDDEAKNCIADAFCELKKTTSIDGIKSIIDSYTKKANRMSEAKYPELKFSITPEEINHLIASGVIGKSHNLSNELNDALTNPLTKLLYATVWKNGDLLKIKHIINGVLMNETGESDDEKAIVFRQFGRHLTKTSGQPIIDQHVIRAFGIFQPFDGKKTWSVEEMRRLSIVSKKHYGIIAAYKEWITTGLTDELKQCPDYTYHVDKLLFALGKTVKYKKKKT